MQKTYFVDAGVALQTRIPAHTTGQQRCVWISMMGVFETHNAKRYRLGSGVALQAPIPVHTTGPEKVFLYTWDGCV